MSILSLRYPINLLELLNLFVVKLIKRKLINLLLILNLMLLKTILNSKLKQAKKFSKTNNSNPYIVVYFILLSLSNTF